jgi:basic amino acid/polyamine antiporter, APA family
MSFKKSLNLIDSTSIVIGSMIGSGIFIVSADVARALGSPGWMLVAWVLAGFMTILAAFSFGELSCIMPHVGGQYVYLREAYSPLAGFLYGWTLFMVINTGSVAAVAMAFAKFSGVLIPCISGQNVILDLGFIKITTVTLVAIASIIFLTWINTRGIEEGKTVQNIFTFLKVFILILFVGAGLIYSFKSGATLINNSYFWNAGINHGGIIEPLSGLGLLAALGIAMVGPLFASDAWYDITFTSEEVKNPEKNIPLSMILGTLIIATTYVLVNWVYIRLLPLRGDQNGINVIQRGIQYASEDRVGTAVIYSILGRSAEAIMAIVVIISTFGCNNGMILSGARVFYTMANDGLFFKNVGKLNSRQVPAVALVIQCVWSCLLCLTGSYNQLLDYVIFAMLLFNLLTVSSVFVLRLKRPDAHRSYKAFGYPFTPAVYIIMSVLLLVILLICKPSYTWPGLGIIAAGIPVFFVWKKFVRK